MVLALAGDSTTTSIDPRLPPLAVVDFLLAAAFLVGFFLVAVDFLLVDLVLVSLSLGFLLLPALFFAGLAFFADALVDFLVAEVLSSSDDLVFGAALEVVEDLALAMAFLAKRSMHDVPPTRQAGTAIGKLQVNEYRRALGRT